LSFADELARRWFAESKIKSIYGGLPFNQRGYQDMTIIIYSDVAS
jgi:hypothetical protein